MKAPSDSLALDFELLRACPHHHHHHHTHLDQRNTECLPRIKKSPHSIFILKLSIPMDGDNHKDDSVEPSLIIVTTQYDLGARQP